MLHFQREPLFEFGGLLRPPPLVPFSRCLCSRCSVEVLSAADARNRIPVRRGHPDRRPRRQIASLLVYPACRLRRGPRVSHLQAPREELAKLALPEDA